MGLVGLHQYLDRVEELLEAQQLEEASAHCLHILEELPRHVNSMRLMGRISLERQEYDEALKIFGEVLQADPEDLIAHAGSGLVWKAKGEFLKAIWHIERAAEIDINNRIVQSELANLYKQVSDFKPAGEEFTAAALARLHFTRGQYDQVKDVIKPILDRVPERHDLQVLFAETLFRLDRKKESAKLSSQIIKRSPNSIKANAILGLIYIQLNKPASAQRFATKLIPLLRPEKVTSDQDSLAGELFTSPLIAAIPERVMVDELELSMVIMKGIEIERDRHPSDLRAIANAGIPGWLASDLNEQDEEEDLKKLREEEIDDIEDIFLWLQAIAAEEGSLIQLDSDVTVSSRNAPGEPVGDSEDADTLRFSLERFDDPIESRFMKDIEGEMIDEDIQSLPPFEDLVEPDGPLSEDDSDLPTWLNEVAGFTDRLELSSGHRHVESAADKKPNIGTAVAGGLMASFYADSRHSQSMPVSEGTMMSEKNEHEQEPIDDSAEQFTDDQWLEELSQKTKDEIEGFGESTEDTIDDLGDIEPGQEVPDWLAADLKAVETVEPDEMNGVNDAALDETVIATRQSLEEGEEVPSWLKAEASQAGAEEGKPVQIEPEDELTTVESTDEVEAYGTVSADITNLASEIPEDPDEAVAWLEQLAAQQIDEDSDIPITILDDVGAGSEKILPEEQLSAPLGEEFQYSLPADDQQAAEWLEEVVAVSFSKALFGKEERLSVIDKEMTPQAYFDVAEAQAEAELIIGEEQGEVIPAEVVDQLPDELEAQPDDQEMVLDWLDDLDAAGEQEADIDGVDMEDSLIEEEPVKVELDTQDPSADDELEWLDTFIDQDIDEIPQEYIEITEDDLEVPATVVVDLSEVSDEQPEEESTFGLELEELTEEATTFDESDSFVAALDSLKEGDIEAALAQYRQSLESGENLPDLVAELESVVDQYEDQPTLKRLLGDAYAENGQLQKALEMYRRALEDI